MIGKLFRQMTNAQILSAAASTVCLMIDSIIIGRFFAVEGMSAYGISSPLIFIFTAIGMMMVNGVQVILGKLMGKGDIESANSCYVTSIIFCLGIGALCILIIFFAGNPIFMLLGAGEASETNTVFMMTRDFLRGYLLGAPFYLLNQIAIAYLQSMGNRSVLLYATIVMSVTDILMDLACVFIFHNGMFGIGLASSISFLAAFLTVLGSFLKPDCMFRFHLKDVRFSYIPSIVGNGSPVLLNQVFYTVRTFLMNHILLSIADNTAVAVFAVFNTIGNMIFSIAVGSGTVTLMLSSIFFNEEDRSSLLSLLQVMFKHVTMLLSAVILFAEILAPWLIQLFLSNDPAILTIAVPGLRIFLIGTFINCLDDVIKNFYQGIGHPVLTNVIAVLQSLGWMIPAVYLFSRLFGLTGFWVGIVAGYFFTMLTICVIVWHKFGQVSFSAEAFSYLDPNFGAKPENLIELSVRDIDETVAASQSLIGFCRQKGIEAKTATFIGLCVEEITSNIIRHGFTEKNQSYNVDVRLVLDEKKRVLRIRDNCANFDPTKYIELHQDDDPAAHIGLRMVMKMVREANYINTLGLNNLTLEF